MKLEQPVYSKLCDVRPYYYNRYLISYNLYLDYIRSCSNGAGHNGNGGVGGPVVYCEGVVVSNFDSAAVSNVERVNDTLVGAEGTSVGSDSCDGVCGFDSSCGTARVVDTDTRLVSEKTLANRAKRRLAKERKQRKQAAGSTAGLSRQVLELRLQREREQLAISQAFRVKQEEQAEISRVFREKQERLALDASLVRERLHGACSDGVTSVSGVDHNEEYLKARAEREKAQADISRLFLKKQLEQAELFSVTSEFGKKKFAAAIARSEVDIIKAERVKELRLRQIEKLAEIERKENWRENATGVPEQQTGVSSSSGGSITAGSSVSRNLSGSSANSSVRELEQVVEEQRLKLVELGDYNKSVRAMCSQNYDETLAACHARDLALKELSDAKVAFDKLSADSKAGGVDAKRVLEMRKQIDLITSEKERLCNENARLHAELSFVN